MQIIKKSFNLRTNDTGSLVFLEAGRDVPFDVKRVYYIFDVADSARRGFHAHRALHQYLICIHGSCKVLLDDGKNKETVVLDKAYEGLYVGPSMWHEMFEFSKDCVLLVLASDYYDEADYIRDYETFLKYITGEIN